MKIADLLKADLEPADVQGLFEDLVYELTNPHCRNEEGPAVMMRFLAILESANDEMRLYLMEKAGEYAFLQTSEFRKAFNDYKRSALRR